MLFGTYATNRQDQEYVRRQELIRHYQALQNPRPKSNPNHGLLAIAGGSAVIVATIALLRWWSRALYIKRLFELRNYIDVGVGDTNIAKSAIGAELNKADLVRLIERTAKWQVYDTTFYLYSELAADTSREAYYTVFEAKLARAVPHLVFDSLSAKGQQFKHLYRQSQRLTLEGDINQYFEVYSPDYYDIDVLSFITPEVIVAISVMAEYDLEFVDDSLLCYAPLLNQAEIEVFKQACLNLFNNVDDNLSAYRDDRLKAQLGRRQVNKFARKLLENTRPYWLFIFGSAVVTCLGAWWSLHLVSQAVAEDVSGRLLFALANPLFLPPLVVTIIAIGQLIEVSRQNAAAEEAFLGVDLKPWHIPD